MRRFQSGLPEIVSLALKALLCTGGLLALLSALGMVH